MGCSGQMTDKVCDFMQSNWIPSYSQSQVKHWEDLQVLMHGSHRDCCEEKVLVP